jgi:hypothetical protein
VRYTPQIEQRILAQIAATPEAEIILPDWAYWEGVDQPWIYVDSMPMPLVRVLYERVIGALSPEAGLQPKPGTSRRSVNPHLWVQTPTLRARAVCPNGHVYTDDDWIEGVGHRCQTCRADKLLGTPSAIDVNRAKTTCPQGHALVRRKNGRRRCLECPRAQTAAWRAGRESA